MARQGVIPSPPIVLKFSCLPRGSEQVPAQFGNLFGYDAGARLRGSECIIDGQGKILSSLKTTSLNCTEELRTDEIAIRIGKMTDGFNPDAGNSCIRFIKVEVFCDSRTILPSKCPWSSSTTGKENYAFDLELPLLKNNNKPFGVPGTAWQVNNTKMIDIQIDQAINGGTLRPSPR
jgi:hypothetical protein